MTAATLRAAAPRTGSYAKYLVFGGAATVAATAFYFNNNNNKAPQPQKPLKNLLPFLGGSAAKIVNTAEPEQGKTQQDFQQVYNDIAKKIEANGDYDGGKGPYGMLVRLAWHASGTYNQYNGQGGSYGGGMIYAPESTDPENAGLVMAKDFLSEIQYKYPWISRGDLWTLGGVAAIQEASGPKIKWRPGRVNYIDATKIVKNGNLPDATRDAAYVRNLFKRLNMSDQETVALIGAHALGSCHEKYSGFDGPWTHSPDVFTNQFYTELLGKWYPKVVQYSGRHQFEDEATHTLMMLPTDISLKEDDGFRKYVKLYAEDEQLFFKDFAAAFAKLLEGGINFGNAPVWTFKTLEEQHL